MARRRRGRSVCMEAGYLFDGCSGDGDDMWK